MDKSSQPRFNFVNLTHPDELKDEETQHRIRRLAMTEVGKARRKPKTKRARNEIILEFRSPPRGQHNRTDFDRFNGSSVDPFAAYPIELDESSRTLVVNIFRHNSNHSTLLRGSWWPVGLYDSATFHNVLSNSQLYIHMHLNGPFVTTDDTISLSHHSKALQIVNEKMKDPRFRTSDAMIGTVGSFMCHDYIIGAFEGWKKHRNAMLKMIDLRGGLDSITREELRITMSWCDLAGSYSMDIPPSLPMPRKWEEDSRSPPSSPKPFSPMSLIWKQQLPMRQDWITIFDDVTQLLSLDRAFTDRQLVAATTGGSWLEPAMFRLLSIRPLYQGNSRENIIEEVCRLGTLMFLAPIWRHMGANPVWTLSFSRNLLGVLSSHRVEWDDLKPLLVWTIYFAAVETRNLADRGEFTFMLAVLMSGMQITEWEELLHIVKGVLWVETVFASSDETIRDDVTALLAGSPVTEPVAEIPEAHDA